MELLTDTPVSLPRIGSKAPEFKAWVPSDDVIVPTAGSCGTAKERMENKSDMICYDWFFCTKKLAKEQV